jgi:predicted permease
MSSLTFALRRLRHDFGYAIAFVLTLGLGIGATTAIFSAVEGILLRPLPYPDADRIVYVQQGSAGREIGQFSFVEVADYRRQASTIDEFIEYGDWQFSVVGLGEPMLSYGGLVTSNYFRVLGIRAQHGRTLIAEDDVENAAPVCVLTHEYWTRAFGADPNVVGRVIELTGIATTIVGVLEPGEHYAGTERADLYANYSTNSHYMGASMQDERTHRMTDVYARLRPGVELASARSELASIATRLHAEYPAAYPPARQFQVNLTPWRDVLVQDARSTLLILMGTVALVLIVAIANVGNLTLTALIRRDRELSIRAALGAQPSELRRHLLVEHGLLALAGALAGVAIAWGGLQQLTDYTARMTLRSVEVDINLAVLGFSLLIAVGASMLFAWVPRIPGAGGALSGVSSGSGTRTTAGRSQRRAQRLLVVGQVALSFVVVVGAGLLVRSLVNLHRVDLGLRTDQVVSLKAPNMGRLPADRNRAVFEEVVSRLQSSGGVSAVAAATAVPFDTTSVFSWRYRTNGARSDEQAGTLLFNTVSADYPKVLDIGLQSGRWFDSRDIAGGEPVVVINQRFAQTAFPDENPVGRQVQWSFDGQQWGSWRTVVGVAHDARDRSPHTPAVPTIYEAFSQAAVGTGLIIRTTGDQYGALQAATRLFHELDPKRPVVEAQTLDDALASRIAPSRLNASLFGGFGLLALGIAAVGVGGVLAFAVSERTREFGVRSALGASRMTILSGVLREGLVLAGVGLLLGALGAAGLSSVLDGMLFEVEAIDPTTFVATALLITGVALVASWIPARRATAVDPATVLRAD